MTKQLNVGMVGYGFMGRTHSNAFSQVGRFFDVPFQPVLKAICARNADKVRAFAAMGQGPHQSECPGKGPADQLRTVTICATAILGA